MKITLNWVKDYVAFSWTPEELAERLTMLGLEVEGMEKIGGGMEGIVIAQVLTRETHPNADKLSVCRVQDGQGERQIVCGATNFQPGDKVPLILPGATLPVRPGEKPVTIKVGRIRGVESHGMMCSPKELGMAEDADGLLVLPADAPVGQSFAAYCGRDKEDVVYDLEVTPNRPDLTSVIGIAREISALTGHPLRMPDPESAIGQTQMAAADPGRGIDQDVAVRIEDEDLCPRYTARLIRGVTIGPSPDWLRNSLEKIGIRSISNVVDVTNYVMWETGQPLHAFDYRLIAKGADGRPTIVVRRARPQEAFTTLDGQAHRLNSEMLLIADETKGIALAGIMGGQNTEVNDQTTDVLIESAYFAPTNIRRTSKALGLRSESSYRFERGADPGLCAWASRRAAQLMLQTAGGTLVPGVVDACPQPAIPREITLRHAKCSALLGLDIPAVEQNQALERLGLERIDAAGPESGVATFRIPTFRVDLKRETDLIEEVCRLFGVDRIPATPPRGAFGRNDFDAMQDALGQVRRIGSGLGLDEAQGQTLIAEEAACLVAPKDGLIRLANPLSSDMNVLRPSLLPGLLDSLRHNVHHQSADVALFEIGRVFQQTADQPDEGWRLAVALMGRRVGPFWGDKDTSPAYDLYDLKGILEEWLDRLGVPGVTYLAEPPPHSLYLEPNHLQHGRDRLGSFGQVRPDLARCYDLRATVVVAELDLNQILARRQKTKSFHPLPAYPASRRDVAMFVSEDVTHEAVLDAVRKARPQHLEKVDLFDVFRGESMPKGQKSVAYALTYRNPSRTLTDAEVNAEHAKVVQQFKTELNATVREG